MAETYRVELLGFPGLEAVEAATALADAFGLEPEQADAYVLGAPAAVRNGVDGATARQYAQELLRIGASVRIVSEITGRAREFTSQDLADRGSAPQKPAAPKPRRPARPRAAPPPKSATAEAARTQTCPACGHRQAQAERCARCDYTFPTADHKRRPAKGVDEAPPTPSAEHEDVDVFENLRSSSERLAVVEETKRRKASEKRRSQSASVRAATGPKRRRIVIYAIIAVLALLTLLLVTLSPGDDARAGDVVPDDALPPPPGFQFRSD